MDYKGTPKRSFFFALLEERVENCEIALADRPLDYPIAFPRHRYRWGIKKIHPHFQRVGSKIILA